MTPETYLKYLEAVVLSLLDERAQDTVDLPSTDDLHPAWAPPTTFAPLNIRECIREQRAQREALERFSNITPPPETPVSTYPWPRRVRYQFIRLGVSTLGQLVQLSPEDLLDAGSNFGVESLQVIRETLADLGLRLRDDRAGPDYPKPYPRRR